ncbi:uncharacterized protein LOC128742501 [Sabethes cyaneus]|uniref:uncharacterized protein LOC128742501 n=1 Tax=Sabethes cyaneus TaxID=53552 RepID=UPI00237DEC7D|nr:uncharacterized protein LOC128742501 [Sabethes cyaneus]
MKTVPLIVKFFLFCCISCAFTQDAEEMLDIDEEIIPNQMFPNERTTLDDCHLRFYKLLKEGEVKPAFGMPVPLKEFAHMGAIGWTQSHGSILWQCGGTLIWDNFVLTAAHCAVDASNQAPDVARFGDIDLFSADDDMYAQQLKIVEIIRHPEHRFAGYYHDIALMRLEKNVRLHDTVAPACLWLDDEIRFRQLEATGWGKTGFAEEQTPILLKVILKPMPNERCDDVYNQETTRKLRNGLQEQHLCAVDDRMDTCEGDSGGPLQTKLLHNSKVTPFIVAITSFGSACGTSTPGVYTRVAPYHDWIVSTMQKKGAKVDENTYNATNCALRYAHLREYDDAIIMEKTIEFTSYNSDLARINIIEYENHLVEIYWENDTRDDCHGVIVDEDTILTIADCTHSNGVPPAYVTYLGEKSMPIAKIHIHPGYSRNQPHNNIAILKMEAFLDLPIPFQPSCLWHDHEIPYSTLRGFGYGRTDINSFDYYNTPIAHDATPTFLTMSSTIFNESNCVLPGKYSTLQLSREHLCAGNDIFLVPESCRLLLGTPLDEYKYINDRKYHVTFALSQFGRDCGFGEYLLATRLASQMEWIKSVLLPTYQDTNSALTFVDRDLQEGSRCETGSGMEGRCVPIRACSVPWRELRSSGTAFCSSSSVICCPVTTSNNTGSNRIHPELLACPALVREKPRGLPFSSMVQIGWMVKGRGQFRCFGSIITKFTVVTSASCLGRVVPQVVELLGEVQKNSFQVDSMLKHPEYNETQNTNDIALVKLRKALTWGEHVFPTCLWTNLTHVPLVMNMIFPDSTHPVAFEQVTPMYNTDCQRTHPLTVQRSQICVRSYVRPNTCVTGADQLRWDSPTGESYLVGMAVKAPACVNWRYMVFTRVSSFVDWISDNVR